MLKKLFIAVVRAPRLPFLWLIRAYQKTLSPDHGLIKPLFPYGYCKFDPTCSEYGYLAIKRYGLVRGVPLSVWRVLRCNPFSRGGDDPVK